MARQSLLWIWRAKEAQPTRSLSGPPQGPCQTEAPKAYFAHTSPIVHAQIALQHVTQTLRGSSRPQVTLWQPCRPQVTIAAGGPH